MDEVVVRHPLEELAAGTAEYTVEVRSGAQVARESRVLDTLISPSVSLANLAGGVGGSVVGYDELEVGEILRENGFERLCKVLLPVVDW